jgi:hypothetical protein
MKKIILIFGFFGLSLSEVFAQSDFVKSSSDLREKGKHFLVVDMNFFENDGQKTAFMELVYAESRMFPVSVVNEKGLWTLCSHASVISEEETRRLISDLKEKAKEIQPDGSTLKKLIQK